MVLLIHSWENKGVHIFPKRICLKVNVIAWLEFELAYYDSVVHRFNHFTTRTPLWIFFYLILRHRWLNARISYVEVNRCFLFLFMFFFFFFFCVCVWFYFCSCFVFWFFVSLFIFNQLCDSYLNNINNNHLMKLAFQLFQIGVIIRVICFQISIYLHMLFRLTYSIYSWYPNRSRSTQSI